MQKLFSVKDESRYTRRWDPDGSAQDLCDEDYAVINFRGEEVFRTPSRIETERWIRIAQLSARIRCAECGGPLHSVKPWRLEDVLGKPLGPRG